MIIILTGVTGSGKSTIAKTLCRLYGFKRIKTVTSRLRRSNESKDEYVFVDTMQFHELESHLICVRGTTTASGDIIDYHGVPCEPYDDGDYVIVLDPDGATLFQEVYERHQVKCYIIEISASSDKLTDRLKRRGVQDVAAINARLMNDLNQLSHKRYISARYDTIYNERTILDACKTIISTIGWKGDNMNIMKKSHVSKSPVLGDEYIITIESAYTTDATGDTTPTKLYKVKGFNSLVFDEAGLNKLTKYEPKPIVDVDAEINEARAELYKAIKQAADMSADELNRCFCGGGATSELTLAKVLARYPAKTFLKRINEWITQGDEVKLKANDKLGVVMSVNGDTLIVLVDDTEFCVVQCVDVVKTGNHVDISVTTAASSDVSTIF